MIISELNKIQDAICPKLNSTIIIDHKKISHIYPAFIEVNQYITQLFVLPLAHKSIDKANLTNDITSSFSHSIQSGWAEGQ